MCSVGLLTLKQHFSAYKNLFFMNSGFVYFYPKVLYVCTPYFPSCQRSTVQCSAACTTCEKYIGLYHFIFKLHSLVDTNTFSQVLTFVLSTKVGDFPRIAFPRSLRKKQSLPLIQSKHSWFYLDRHIIFKMSAGKIVNASKGLFLIWYHIPRPLFDF